MMKKFVPLDRNSNNNKTIPLSGEKKLDNREISNIKD